MPPNYARGKIYKLVNSVTREIYVGSTVKRYLCDRKAAHSQRSKELAARSPLYTAIRQHGMDKFEIELLETYPCNSKDELLARERYYIETLRPQYNVRTPIRDAAERKAKARELAKADYAKNKEKVCRRKAEKLPCPCGATVSRGATAKHLDSIKHRVWSRQQDEKRQAEMIIPEWMF